MWSNARTPSGGLLSAQVFPILFFCFSFQLAQYLSHWKAVRWKKFDRNLSPSFIIRVQVLVVLEFIIYPSVDTPTSFFDVIAHLDLQCIAQNDFTAHCNNVFT